MSDILSFRLRDTIFTSMFRSANCFARLMQTGNYRCCKTHYRKRRSKIVSHFLHDVPPNFRFARLLPNARTAFTFDLFKKIPRRRNFRRYLSLFEFPTPYCIDFFFNTLRTCMIENF